MGEYAYRKSDNEYVKIGTCETMFGLRYEDRHLVRPAGHSINPMKVMDCFWRLPLTHEDGILIGEYSNELGIPLYQRIVKPSRYHANCDEIERIPFTPNDLEPGRIQLRHPSGMQVLVSCHHGMRLPTDTDDVKFCWNGKDPYHLELCYVKNTQSRGVIPVFRCRHCEKMWSCEWSEIIDFIPDDELKNRLSVHCSSS